ncbi:MAG: hypothetical protein U0704_07395 [Candidatus Eisenbacteria bacterium]
MRSPFTVLAFAALTSCLFAGAALAQQFDFIYSDRAEAAICDGCGIMLAEQGYAVLVNTGPVPITVAQMEAAVFHATSNVPGVEMGALLNNWGPTFTDLAPGHARGPAIPLFLPLLLPGEVLEDTQLPPPGHQFLAYWILRDPGNTYVGPVTFHVTLDLAGQWVEYTIVVNLTFNPPGNDPGVTFTHATRASSTFPPLPARHTTWGAVKSTHHP